MPVVRMRRTSRRVFGARVLRSGRRVMTSSPTESKTVKGGWIALLEDGGDDAKSTKRQVGTKNVDDGLNLVSENRWGVVYSRKRKRLDCVCDGTRRFGKYYVRKRYLERRFLGVFAESLSCNENGLLGGFLESVLRYMKRAELGLSQLSVFVLSGSLACAYSALGIRFSRDSLLNKSSGICKIFEAKCFVPSFVVDFSALPSCFLYLHASLFLKSTCSPLPLSYLIRPVDEEPVGVPEKIRDEEMVEALQQEPCTPSANPLGIQISPSVNVNTGRKSSLKASFGVPRIPGRSVQFKTGIITRSIQKRRSPLRSKRVKSSYVLRGRLSNGARLSNLLSIKPDSLSLPPPVKLDVQLNSAWRNTSFKSALVELTKDIGSSSCSANILVVEAVKCYRIVGAVIELEKSVSRKWSLAVKKDGKKIYSLNAFNIMRPCSSNRVTHDIIWREENNNWKLEFPDRAQWVIFKELYKECCERNIRALPANIIPVPGVQEVPDYMETNKATFTRPNLYITVRDGELSRAMAKETANYDMDSEDEEWLNKLNNDSSMRNEQSDNISEDTFEIIIDALEKAFFHNPDNYSDEKTAVDSFLHLERKEVVEAVYSYWMNKRKQKRSALVQVFQFYQPRKTQLLSKPFIRKKRSFKRQPSRPERAKQRTFLPLVAREPDPAAEQKAFLKVEEAKAATSRSVDAAIKKRSTAQVLMQRADVATYKAAMAMRIAEAALLAESFQVSDPFLLE